MPYLLTVVSEWVDKVENEVKTDVINQKFSTFGLAATVVSNLQERPENHKIRVAQIIYVES